MIRKVIASLTFTVAAWMFAAGTAQADVDDYMVHLAQHGLPADSAALAVGRAICRDIRANGFDGIERQYDFGLDAGMASKSVAAMIFYAAADLCPDQLSVVKAWATAPITTSA